MWVDFERLVYPALCSTPTQALSQMSAHCSAPAHPIFCSLCSVSRSTRAPLTCSDGGLGSVSNGDSPPLRAAILFSKQSVPDSLYAPWKISFTFHFCLSSLMWNLQSYPTTVLNERMTFLKGQNRPSYIFSGSRPLNPPGLMSLLRGLKSFDDDECQCVICLR